MSGLLRLNCSVVLWGGRDTANKYHLCVCGVFAVSGPHWVCPSSWRMCFPGLHCSGFRLLCRGTFQSGPWVHVLPRSKLLRFRFSGTPQGHRLSWACVLCPSQVRAAQATRCLVNILSLGGVVTLITSLVLALGFLSVQWECHLRCAMSSLWN